MGGVPHHHSAAGDGFTVKVAQLLTVDAAGTTVSPVFTRTAAMPPPSPVVAIVTLMPSYLWVRKKTDWI